jgi:S-adenosylmethionine decarboxylase proenzyme
MKHHIIGVVRNVCIKTTSELAPIMERVVKKLRLNEVNRAFHQFEPYGATGVIVLSESHFSAHTYPEDNNVYLDIFCCSKDFSTDEAVRAIHETFGSESFDWQYVER